MILKRVRFVFRLKTLYSELYLSGANTCRVKIHHPSFAVILIMTFYHFLNCALLAYGPQYVAFYGLGLGEDRGLGFLCLRSAFFYVLAQMFKMILIATFIPVTNLDAFHVATEIRRVCIALVDVLAVYFVFSWTKVNVERKKKELAIGMGWSLAEAVFGCFLPLFNYARGSEFSWSNIQLCLGANISIVSSIGFATVVSLLSYTMSHKSKNNTMFGPAAVLLLWHLLSCNINAGIPLFAKNILLLNTWTVLMIQFIVAVIVLSGARFLSSSKTVKRS